MIDLTLSILGVSFIFGAVALANLTEARSRFRMARAVAAAMLGFVGFALISIKLAHAAEAADTNDRPINVFRKTDRS